MREKIIRTLIVCYFFLSINCFLTLALTQQDRTPATSIPLATPNRKVGRAEVTYFQDSGKTGVDVLNLTIWGKNDDRIDLNMSYSTPGSKPRLPEAIEIDFASVAKRHRFKGKSTVEFIVDSKKWEPISVEPQILEESDGVIEDYVFLLSVERVRQIGKAKSVVVKLGSIVARLSAEHRQAFLDLLRAAE